MHTKQQLRSQEVKADLYPYNIDRQNAVIVHCINFPPPIVQTSAKQAAAAAQVWEQCGKNAPVSHQ